MSIMSTVRRIAPDPFIIALLTAVLLASLLPCKGIGATIFGDLTNVAIGVLFFMHGVRLSREALIAGATYWRLHLVILACTFVLYPALGLGFSNLAPHLLPRPLWIGVLFTCLLPSTVQSSIAFVSVARGNVAAAICSATVSNLLGIFLTPILAGWLLSAYGGIALTQVWKIFGQLLLPFIVGHLLRPWLGAWAARNKAILTISDRGSIVLAVYTTFSAAVVGGIWSQASPLSLVTLLAVNAALLGAVMLISVFAARALGFNKADEIAILFCGSKKSLATGIPMANVLFAGPTAGLTILPLMIFHQMQLMVAAGIARRYAKRDAAIEDVVPSVP